MKISITSLIALSAMLFSSIAPAEIELGKDYSLLDPAQPASSAQIEVLEFFYYGSENCYRLNQEMTHWYSAAAGDVMLTRVPVILDDSMEPMARLYYALQSLERADGLHDRIYNDVQIRGIDLVRQLSDSASRLNLAQTLAVDPVEFSAAYSSPELERRLTNTETVQQRYQIIEIPALVVDGKYKIGGLTPERTVQVLKEVVQLVRAGRPGAASPASEESELTAQPNVLQPPSRGDIVVDQSRPAARDVTHCLDLENYAEIAKCTGEQ